MGMHNSKGVGIIENPNLSIEGLDVVEWGGDSYETWPQYASLEVQNLCNNTENYFAKDKWEWFKSR